MPTSNTASNGADDTFSSALRRIWPFLAVLGTLAIVASFVIFWAEARQYWMVVQGSLVVVFLLLSSSAWALGGWSIPSPTQPLYFCS